MRKQTRNQEELILLQKRARRRLVGALALSLLALTVLLKVTDSTPQNNDIRPDSVIIASEAHEEAVEASPNDIPNPEEPSDATAAAIEPVPIPKPQIAAAPLAVAPKVADAAQIEAERAEAARLQALRLQREREDAARAAAEQAERQLAIEKAKEAERAQAERLQAKLAAEKAERERKLAAEKAERERKLAAEKAEKEKAAKLAAEKTEKATKAEPSKTFVVQVAALSDAKKADELRAKLAGMGLKVRVVQVQTDRGTIHRVRLGPFNAEQEAKAAQARASQAGMSGIIIPQ